MIERKDYLVSITTIALTEFYHPEYRTKIYDQNGIFYSRKTAKQLLDQACLVYGANYNGRIESVRRAFPYHGKTPLMLCPVRLIYAFPTISPQDFECRWIFPAHIEDYIIENNHLYALFKNGMKVELNCSLKTYMRQKERTAHCLTHFSIFYRNHPSKHNQPDDNIFSLW